MIELEFDNIEQDSTPAVQIKVLGVGGGGTNMVNSMIDSGCNNVDFIVANTDAQSLKMSKASKKIQLGTKSTRGLGAGANPEVGRKAAEEDIDKILEEVKDSNVVFLTAGLGGGTGSGSMPVIAKALKERDILTIAVVTKPFMFEGKRRMKVAQESLELIKREVDTLIVLPNQKLIDVVDQKASLVDSFNLVNNVLNQFLRSIVDIIVKPGLINVDFADVKTIMKQRGFTVIGTGKASGPDRAVQAIKDAMSSPLLENIQISGARGVLLNISGSSNLSLHEVSAAAQLIYEQAHEDATIVLGSVIDDSLEDNVVVSLIVTGFNLINPESMMEHREIKPKLEPQYVQQLAQPQPTSEKPVEQIKTNIDFNNIDIPALMRKMAQDKQQQNS